MKKVLWAGLVLWAIVCVFPSSVSAQALLDFSEAAPEIVFNGTDYFFNIPEIGFMGNRYGGQWRLDLNNGSWPLRSIWNVWNQAFVVTTDYSTGSFSTIDLSTLTTNAGIGAIHSDAVALRANGILYVINRLGQDNITVYNPADLSTPVRQFSVGNGSNPQVLVLITPTKAYVTLNEKDYILIVNPQTGLELGRIDIASYADVDGIPEAGPAILYNGGVYVALQLMDRNNFWTPSPQGKLLKINAATDTIEGSMDLALGNPGTLWYHRRRSQLLAGCAGTYISNEDGGIVAVNTTTMTSEGVLIRESTLGGNLDLGNFVMADSSKGYAIVSDESGNQVLVSFNLNTGAKLADVFAPASGFSLSNIAIHNGLLYVCDRTLTAPGVRIFNALDDSQITTAPINVGLPPFMIAFY